MINLLLIAAGGALGSLLRSWVAELVSVAVGSAFIWSILLINVSGSFLIGLAAGASWDQVRLSDSTFVRYFIMVGLCGGYTTFSSFSLQTFALLQAGETARAFLNMSLSILTCLLATWAGFGLAAAVSR